MEGRRRRAVILVENLPVPLDRHVWQMALALRDAGWAVSVICPATAAHPERRLMLDGIDIRRHWLPAEGHGFFGLLAEYAVALFQEARLLLGLRVEGPVDVVHVCNPPDLLFLVAAPFRLLGARILYDVHDLVPELFEARFGQRRLIGRMVRAAEWLSARLADRLLVSNDSFRDRILARCPVAPDRVDTCYTIPKTAFLGTPRALEAPVRPRILGYLGIMGEQDGIDHLIDMVAELKGPLGQAQVKALLVGDGPALPAARARAQALGLGPDDIAFHGFLTGEPLRAILQQFDIGIIPDPPNGFNDIIPMNKVFEYSALGIPSVSYPLAETCRLLGDAGTYAEGPTPADLARATLRLLDDPMLHLEKARAALALSRARFRWETEAAKLVAAYEAMVPARGAPQ